MEQEKTVTDFLALAYMYFREEKNIDFYAERIGVSSEALGTLLEEISGKKFEDWLEHIERVTS